MYTSQIGFRIPSFYDVKVRLRLRRRHTFKLRLGLKLQLMARFVLQHVPAAALRLIIICASDAYLPRFCVRSEQPAFSHCMCRGPFPAFAKKACWSGMILDVMYGLRVRDNVRVRDTVRVRDNVGV